jgi:hypothetical protein
LIYQAFYCNKISTKNNRPPDRTGGRS